MSAPQEMRPRSAARTLAVCLLAIASMSASCMKGSSSPPSPPSPTPTSLPSTTTAPPDPSSAVAPPQIHWNAWAEAAPGGSLQPAYPLNPNTPYTLNVHLTLHRYYSEQGPITYREVHERLRQDLMKWVDETTSKEEKITAVLLIDSARFKGPALSEQTFAVDLEKLSQARRSGIPPAQGSLEERAAVSALGKVRFDIETSAREGLATVSVSFWVRGRPLDELTIPLCVTAGHVPPECMDQRAIGSGLGGVDSLRVATQSLEEPDLSLVVLDRPEGAVGVMKGAKPGDPFLKWPIQRSASDLSKFLATTLSKPIAGATSEDQLRRIGQDVTNTLFPNVSPEAMTAKARLEAVAERAYKSNPGRYSVFMRIVRDGPEPLIFPLGLVYLKGNFIGRYLRVESPLNVQTYADPKKCVARWVTVAPPAAVPGTPPPADEALEEARTRAKAGLDTLSRTSGYRSFKTLREFGDWLRDGTPETSLSLLTLSHHGDNMLSFAAADTANVVTSAAVAKHFGQPSIAILAGCSTAGAGASRFIAELSLRGVNAVVVTTSSVPAGLAGDLLACLAEDVESHPKEQLWDLYFHAQECAAEKRTSATSGAWGAETLRFALIGDGGVRLCASAAHP